MNRVFMAVLAGVAFSGAMASAHGDAKPHHGGLVQVSGETRFELVSAPDGAQIYLEDDGAAMSAANVSGKLTVMSGAAKSEAKLEPAGDRLVAKGMKLAKGDKVIAVVTLPDKTTASARFVIK